VDWFPVDLLGVGGCLLEVAEFGFLVGFVLFVVVGCMFLLAVGGWFWGDIGCVIMCCGVILVCFGY